MLHTTRDNQHETIGQSSAVPAFTAGALVITLLFLIGTLGRAHQKLLWHDEIFTVVLASLSPGALWQALRDGVDLNPPGVYLLTRASHGIFGESLIGSRLPGLLGVALSALCAGAYVRRRHGTFAGWCAMLLLLGSDAHQYAYEARPYGLVLGFAGLALICWQSAIGAGRRRLWLLGLFASLAGAISCHYYGVLLLAPIAAGELSRWFSTRRADWPLWMTVAGSTSPLAAFWPLIRATREYSAGFFGHPSVTAVFESYESTLSLLAVPLLIALVMTGGALLLIGPEEAGRDTTRRIARHEWVAAATLMMLPVLVYAFAVAVTGAIVPRYYLAWTIGFAIVVPSTIASVARHPQIVLFSLAGALFLWIGAWQAVSARWLLHPSPDLASSYPLLAGQTNGDVPIVVRHPHVYLMAVHYAPPELAARLVVLTVEGPPDTAIRGFRALQAWKPLRLQDMDQFLAEHRQFLVFGPTADAVLDWLRTAGAVMVLRGIEEDRLRFPMSRPGPYSLYDVTYDGRIPTAGANRASESRSADSQPPPVHTGFLAGRTAGREP